MFSFVYSTTIAVFYKLFLRKPQGGKPCGLMSDNDEDKKFF